MKLRRFSGISFRNLRARAQRTLLTAIGIVLGVGILFGVEPGSAALATGFELTEGRFPRNDKEITLDGGSAEVAGLRIGDEVTMGTPRGPEKLGLVGLLRIPGGSFGGLAF